MEQVKSLNSIVKKNNLFGSCDNCGLRHRHTDATGLRKWCSRCIDVFHRKTEVTTGKAERQILNMVGEKYRNANFKDFTGSDVVIREAMLAVKPDEDIFVYGQVGTGKTYALAALLRNKIYEGFTCKRINFDDFCVELRTTMSPTAERNEFDITEPLRETDVLFIDDLGLRSKQETDFAYVTLYSLLNKRQERMLPTYICSNKTIEQLGRNFDARIASRLSTAKAILVNGQDRRRNQA